MKNLTDWHKMVETGMDLLLERFVCHRNHLVAWVAADINFWVERRDITGNTYVFAGYLRCGCWQKEIIFDFQSPD